MTSRGELGPVSLSCVAPFSGKYPDFALPFWRSSSVRDSIYIAVANELRLIERFLEFEISTVKLLTKAQSELVRQSGDALPYAFAFSQEDIVIGDKAKVAESIRLQFKYIERFTFSAVSAAKFADMSDQLPELYLKAYRSHEKLSPTGARVWRDMCVLLPIAQEILSKKFSISPNHVSITGNPLRVEVYSSASEEQLRTTIHKAWQATNLSPEKFALSVQRPSRHAILSSKVTSPAEPDLSGKNFRVRGAWGSWLGRPRRPSISWTAEPLRDEVVTLRHVAAEVAETHGLSEKQANEVLSEAIAIIGKHIKQGTQIRIAGLGTLQVRTREARMGRNPATGEAIKIKPSKKVAFRPEKKLADIVANATSPRDMRSRYLDKINPLSAVKKNSRSS